MDDAINQLVDLGITKGQAKKALARYNNDVARAADFIFSGNNISDDEEESNVENDEALAIRLNKEEEETAAVKVNQKTCDNNNGVLPETATEKIDPSTASDTIKPNSATLQKSNTDTVSTLYDSSNWNIVPFKDTSKKRTSQTAVRPTSFDMSKSSSLTWWKDPEDPSNRIALDDLPIGLRPPSYNFAYSPIIIQALFHITAFQEAILSFRPIPYAWSAPENYWKGHGDPVPGYIMRQIVTMRQATLAPEHSSLSPTKPPSPPPESAVPLHSEEETKDLISFEDSDSDLSINKDNNDETQTILSSSVPSSPPPPPTLTDNSTDIEDINKVTVQSNLPPPIVETLDIEETVKFVEHVENELQMMPKCLQAVAEMQKLFAFLGNTRRLYGSASHFVRALNTKLTSNGWEFSDKTFEAFLDMTIHCLVEADEQADETSNDAFIAIFRNFFLTRARVEYDQDYDDEEVYYLTLTLDKNMNSFHDCLDPLIFESYETHGVPDLEADPDISDNEEPEEAEAKETPQQTYKFTTFKHIPPLLFIVLDNRSSLKNTSFEYKVENTVYMDRYMIEKKDTTLAGFKEMESCRKEIEASRSELEKLKFDSTLGLNKQDLLDCTLAYFEQESKPDELENLKEVLNSVKRKIESRQSNLEASMEEQKVKMHSVFDRDDMKENAYNLRATFHHDGKNGTGHYWAYIWIEPSGDNLLVDIPNEGGWFKFCDALVTAASEEDIMNDTFPPFSLLYASASLPKFTKESLYERIPESLKEFMTADNNLLSQEINAYHRSDYLEESDSSISTASEDSTGFTEKGSINFDDCASIGTTVSASARAESQQRQQSIEIPAQEDDSNSEEQFLFTGQEFNKLKDRVNSRIVEVSTYPPDDYRFLESFETFLARAQNQLVLEHLYLLYSSEELINGQTTVVINEKEAKKDTDMKIIWHEYESYLVIGEVVTQALSYFAKKEYQEALQGLMSSKRHEATWKTRLMFDIDTSSSYSGLDTLTFNTIIETYGKQCLKILNDDAYVKASNPSYKTRGLEDAICLARQAQVIIGPDSIMHDPMYGALGEKWMTLAEQASSMSENQTELLNTLIMSYLEGQAPGAPSGLQSRAESPITSGDDEELENHSSQVIIPLWKKYKELCSQLEQPIKATLS